MFEDEALIQPGPDATPQARAAYRQAYCDRAMATEQRRLHALHLALRAKVRPSDGQRAFEALSHVLAAAGFDAQSAAQAQFNLEYWDECDMPPGEHLSDEECRAATAWRDAVEAARVELCDKAPFVSPEAFELVDFLARDPKETFERAFPLPLSEVT